MCSSGATFAQNLNEDKITLIINGNVMNLDQPPMIIDNRVLHPIRAVLEELGCCVFYNETTKTIDVLHGENNVSLFIGEKSMSVNYEEKEIDVAPTIYNNRTLVPIRAVSEALGADVKWYEDTKTVSINLEQGEHKIRSKSIEKKVKNENGIILMSCVCTYPSIENLENNSYINEINEYYQTNAENFMNDKNADDLNYWKDFVGDIEDYPYIEYGPPVTFELYYNINTDKDGILSITDHIIYYYGGAHPNSVKESKTFDLKREREVTLEDVLQCNKSERHNKVYDLFLKYLKEHPEDVWAESASLLNEEVDYVNFFLTDNSIILNLPIYSIAPYSIGYPTVEIPYSKELFGIN